MGETSIEWTDVTWNPMRGCSPVGPECENCYAAELAARFADDGLAFAGLARRSGRRRLPQWTGRTTLVPGRLGLPLQWKRPRRIFVTSVSDPFHDGFTNEEIGALFGVMAASPQHTFQLLTKRPRRAREWFRWIGRAGQQALDRVACFADDLLSGVLPTAGRVEVLAPGRGASQWPLPNVHFVVSAGTQASADQLVPELLEIPAAVRGVSCEPLLEPVNLLGHMMSSRNPGDCANCGKGHGFTRCPNYGGVAKTSDEHRCASFRRVQGMGIDWVIVGGESGPRARPFGIGWARDIIGQCRKAGVPVFVKQMGARPVDAAGPVRLRDRKGGDIDEWPEDLRVREYPR